jgi:predicted AAA+ superfamily ATPase
MKMRPMTLFESGDSQGTVSLEQLFDTNTVEPAKSTLDYAKAIELICRGGWPAVIDKPLDVAMDLARDYLEALITTDISRVDGTRRDPAKLRVFLRSLARTVATPAKITTLQSDIAMHNDDFEIADKTIGSYLGALRQIFVLEEQEAWPYALRSKKQIRTSPNRHFTDPSLAAAALGATPDALAHDTQTAGLLFESMCVRDLTVYMQALKGQVYYYRDSNGLEVDAILQLDDGRWGAAEIKMGTFQYDEATENLLALQKLVDGIVQPPSFKMILTATAGYCATTPEGVHIVPLDCLRP